MSYLNVNDITSLALMVVRLKKMNLNLHTSIRSLDVRSQTIYINISSTKIFYMESSINNYWSTVIKTRLHDLHDVLSQGVIDYDNNYILIYKFQ